MLVRCPSCKGGKKIMGIGMIYKTCLICNGEGQVKCPQHMRSLETPVSEPKNPGHLNLATDLPTQDTKHNDDTCKVPTKVIQEEHAPIKVHPINEPIKKPEEKPKNQKGSSSNGKKGK